MRSDFIGCGRTGLGAGKMQRFDVGGYGIGDSRWRGAFGGAGCWSTDESEEEQDDEDEDDGSAVFSEAWGANHTLRQVLRTQPPPIEKPMKTQKLNQIKLNQTAAGAG